MEQKELVDLCIKGDGQALSLLYTTYASRMKKICFQYVSDEQIAQDLLHDGFIIIFTSIKTLRSPEKLEYWMGTIMKNLSLRYLQEQHAQKSVPVDTLTEEDEPIADSGVNDLPSYNMILKTIESLPKGYSEVFKLSILEGLSHKEIGSLLNIAPHSSSSQLARAKEMLRRLLSTYYICFVIFIISSIIALQFFIYKNKRVAIAPKHNLIIQSNKKESSRQDNMRDPIIIIPDIKLYHSKISSIDSIIHKEVEIVALNDSTMEKIDSVSLNASEIKFEERQASSVNNLAVKENKERTKWSLSLSYTVKEQSQTFHAIKGDITSGKKAIEKSYYSIPVAFSLSFSKKVDHNWGIETGLQYTFLYSRFSVIDQQQEDDIQKSIYLGMPVKATLDMFRAQRILLYGSVGATIEVPIKSTSDRTIINDGMTTFLSSDKLYPSIQMSTHLGLGIQYQVTPYMGIYAEPSLHYYFKNKDNIKNIRTENPLNISLPIGIRFSW